MILTFASSKGGVGKSTACAAIGARLTKRGESVLIIDLDQNMTLERWGRKAKIAGMEVRSVGPDDFTTVFRVAAQSGLADHILIDLAGNREAIALKAIARSDLVIIPAQASEPDLREALVIVSDVKDVGEDRGLPIPFRILLTKMPALRTRVMEFAYEILNKHALPFFRTSMIERTGYREMFFTGIPPSDDTAAGQEVLALITEIESLLGESGQGGVPEEPETSIA